MKWEKLLRPVSQAGVGLKDPDCVIDAMIMKLLRNMRTKEGQPWVGWMKRREGKVRERWEVDDVYGHKPTRKALSELDGECLFEAALKIWHEAGGMTKRRWREGKKGGRGRQRKRGQEEDAGEGKEEADELGMEIKGEWTMMKNISTRGVYEKLVQKRFKKVTEEQRKKKNWAMTKIKNDLTPKEREFWWRTAHKTYMTNDRVHKFMIDARGRKSNECKMCQGHKETWDHMEYDCTEVQRWLTRIEQVYENYVEFPENAEEWKRPTREEWGLKGKMSRDRMMVIAISRLRYHKEWCMVNYGKKRRLDVEMMAERVMERLDMVREQEGQRAQRAEQEEEGEEQES